MIGLLTALGVGYALVSDEARRRERDDRNAKNLEDAMKAASARSEMRKFLLERGLKADDSILDRMGV